MIIPGVQNLLKSRRRESEWKKIYREVREFTMIPEEWYYHNLEIAETVLSVPGCVVECGVWRGGMSAGLSQILGKDRDYYLFDSFEGLPKASEIDGPAAKEWQKNTSSSTYYDNCSASPEFAAQAMRKVDCTSFHLIKGWFSETLPNFSFPIQIALLRLDGDWYESTMSCLESLFDKVIPGGAIILDDYHTWDGCSRALHDFLSRRSATERIRSLGEVCYLYKKPGNGATQ